MSDLDKNFKNFVVEVKSLILESQYKALKTVNKELINLYWNLGKFIVEKQKKYSWGDSVVENLSKELQLEFPGISGFSAGTLRRMKAFYSSYFDNEKLAPLVREISWTKNVLIFEKCKNELEREFYIKMTKKFGWTKNVLKHQIENQSYEKYMTNQTNFEKSLPNHLKSQAKLAIKDEYTFDFLELSAEHSERELEESLILHIKKSLQEFGGFFSLVGTQYKLEIGDQEYFIDVLLFHRELQCLVAIELKITEFKPEFAGKMNFYLSALNEKVKLKHENPSIGIILCKEKNRTIVEYSLKDSSKPIGVGTYNTTKSLPKKFEGLLPSVEELKKTLEELN